MANNNNNKILNVPNLRFPEFTGEWKKCKLGDVANLTKGVGISKGQKSSKGNPCILYGELYTTYKSEMITDIVSKTNIDSANLVKSRYNDVIIPASGETAIDISTARCVQYNDVLLGGDLNIIRLNDGNDGSFFSYQLNGVRKRDIAKVAQGVSVVHLYGENLKAIKVNSPELAEQNKISSLLCLIDQRISTQNKIIEDFKKLKSAIVEKILFSICEAPSIFLGSIAYITNGNGDVQDANLTKQEGWYPFFDRSEEIKWFPSYSFDKEAIIYAGEGQSFSPRYYKGKFALHQRCYAIIDFDKRALPRYCYHYMNTMNSYFVKKAVGSTVPSLRMDTFEKAKIRIPSLVEQKRICTIIDSLCSKIELEYSLLYQIESLKSYLLQQMFI